MSLKVRVTFKNILPREDSLLSILGNKDREEEEEEEEEDEKREEYSCIRISSLYKI